MSLKYPKLTLSGTVDGTSTTGVFEFTSADVEPFIRTGEFFQSADGVIQAARSSIAGSRRNEVQIDGGSGVAGFRIEFNNWEGSDAQWGDSSTKGLTTTSATGQEPRAQVSVLFKYLIDIDIDSTNPAKFEWAEFADSGQYKPVQVGIEEPSLPRSREESSTFGGSLTLISVADLSDELDRFETPI